MSWVLGFCLLALSIAAGLVIIRLLLGPTVADRVVALDTLLLVVTMAVGVRIAQTHDTRYVPLLIVIGLLAFVGTVAAARFIERDLRDGDR